MYTYAGDANLDGAITGDDYFQIDSSFPQQLKGWFNGDFNYDGAITGDDYFLIDSNFPQQAAPFPVTGALSPGGRSITPVPEPTTVALFAGAGAFAMRRGNNRSHLARRGKTRSQPSPK
jgi:hypothetical protein